MRLNMCFFIKNKGEFKLIQKRLFELGYFWEKQINLKRKICTKLKGNYLVTDKTGRINWQPIWAEEPLYEPTRIIELYMEPIIIKHEIYLKKCKKWQIKGRIRKNVKHIG